jgi:integrase/recombinase XerD
MHNAAISIDFRSRLAPWMTSFVQEKLAMGYRFKEEIRNLRRLDDMMYDAGLSDISPETGRCWIAKRPNERPKTQMVRASIFKQFARYLCMRGVNAWVPLGSVVSCNSYDYVPYVFTRTQIQALLAAVDHIPSDSRSPNRERAMPLIFRLLYGCGLRLTESLQLRVGDIDINAGVLTIREAKFHKDRLVPVSESVINRLREYAAGLLARELSAPFFPSPCGGCYSKRTVYRIFRQLLRQCGISHGGRGKGPRIHDLRHTFAVHRLEAWYRAGEDIGALLPVLSAYLGHEDIAGTQRYLRLTSEIFPDIVERLERYTGHIIPQATEKGTHYETN